MAGPFRVLCGYHGQSWPRTLAEFLAIAFAYLASLVLALLGTVVISALVT
jgi:hypothetical protein